MSRTASRASLVLCAAGIAILVAEVVARLVGVGTHFANPFNTPTRTVDGVLLWNHKQPRYDGADIRRAAADRGAFKILGLGDSIMYGIGQAKEETYLEQTRRALAGRSTRAVEILNLAVPGFNTMQENAAYKEIEDQIRPDLVIVHYWGDDAIQYGVVGGLVFNLGDIAPDGHLVRALPLSPRLSDFLLMHSRLYDLLTEVALARNRNAQPQDWTRVTMPLAAIHERALRAQARLLVLASADLSGPSPKPTFELAALREFAAPRGIEVIDLTEWLRGVDSKQIGMDGCHLNAEGHRLIGEHLADYLLRHDLQP